MPICQPATSPDPTHLNHTPDLNHLLYLSSSRWLLGENELQALLATARRNNERDGLTGMLLYQRGSFIQYIEGPTAPLAALWKKIQADTRHRGIIVGSDGPATERTFQDWSMGFQDGSRFGGFDLDCHELQKRLPNDFPTIIKSLMRAFYLGHIQGNTR